MNFFKKIFGKREKSTKKKLSHEEKKQLLIKKMKEMELKKIANQKNKGSIQIDEKEIPKDIGEYIRNMGKISERELSILNYALFSMKEWYFIPVVDGENLVPQYGRTGKNTILFVFTSHEEMKKYCENEKLINEANPERILKIPVLPVISKTHPLISQQTDVLLINGKIPIKFFLLEDSYFTSFKALEYEENLIKEQKDKILKDLIKYPTWYLLLKQNDFALIDSFPLDIIPIYTSESYAKHNVKLYQWKGVEVLKIKPEDALDLISIKHSKIALGGIEYVAFDMYKNVEKRIPFTPLDLHEVVDNFPLPK